MTIKTTKRCTFCDEEKPLAELFRCAYCGKISCNSHTPDSIIVCMACDNRTQGEYEKYMHDLLRDGDPVMLMQGTYQDYLEPAKPHVELEIITYLT